MIQFFFTAFSEAILLAAGITARISSILLVPVVAWLADVRGIAWTTFLGSSMLTLLGVRLFTAMVTNPDSAWVNTIFVLHFFTGRDWTYIDVGLYLICIYI